MSEAFPGQREGEEVELIFRRHMMTAWRGLVWLIVWTVIGVAPTVVQWQMLGGVEHDFASLMNVPREYPTLFYIWLACFVVGILGLVYNYMLWHFSYYLVTNQRVRQVRQRGIFRKKVVDLSLDKIGSISYEVPGIFGGMLGYGTLIFRTQAGEMRVSMVRKPEEAYNMLQDLIGR